MFKKILWFLCLSIVLTAALAIDTRANAAVTVLIANQTVSEIPSQTQPGTFTVGMPGDINGDGTVDISDVILCLRQAVGLDTPNPSVADMNGDGTVDISDVILILRKAVGLS